MTLIETARQYVAQRIATDFHDKRIASLQALQLRKLLQRKNPYLFKAKAIHSAPDLVLQLLRAHLSSQEETLFGAFLEGLAIHVCAQAFGGQKSSSEGIDLDFERDQIRYLVSVKSSPHWGNSSQIARMVQNFDRARKIIGPRQPVLMVNGCCYGKDASPKKAGNYLKLCGQDFWYLVSGDPNLYQEIIEPLGYQARQRNDAFDAAFGRLHTQFSTAFAQQYCLPDGAIDWHQIVALNAQSKQLWQA